MKTLALAITLIVLTAFGASAADVSWEKWISEKKVLLVATETGIKNIRILRDAACPRYVNESHATCITLYNLGIALRQAQKARLEMWLKAVQLSPADRDRIINDVASVAEYNQLDAQTTNMIDKTWRMFNDPNFKAK